MRVFDMLTGPIRPLRWTPDGRAILYTTRQNGVGNVWRQPLDGGAPTQLTLFTSDDLSYFDITRDGRLALSRGSANGSVVMLGGWR